MSPDDQAPRCECGYVCQGDTKDARVRDGQRHARAVHGIEVTPAQILAGGAP